MRLTNSSTRLMAEANNLFQRRNYLWNKVVRHITVDRPPVFIVGCGHSGTSLLLAILGTHSKIYAVPYESCIAFKDDRAVFQTASKRFDAWTISAGKRRWVEKSPRHIYYIGRILEWCPTAKILLMIRDGRDVAYSIQARTGSLEHGIRRWVIDNLAGKEYWQHPNVCLVKYEDLISDFELTVSNILTFLNEDFEAGLKDFHRIPRKWYARKIEKPATRRGKDHNQYRNWQINQPLFDGRGQWQKLSDAELTQVNTTARQMLAELGYTETMIQRP